MPDLIWASLDFHVKVPGAGFLKRRERVVMQAKEQLEIDLRKKGIEPVPETFKVDWESGSEGKAHLAGVRPIATLGHRR